MPRALGITPAWLLAARVVVAVVWIYEGLWLKVIARAPNELAVVAALPSADPLPRPATLLTLIGIGETLLGLAVLVGWQARALAWFQVGLLVVMNSVGIVFAGGSAIPDPVGLIVHNLPFVVCILASGLAPRTPEPMVSGA